MNIWLPASLVVILIFTLFSIWIRYYREKKQREFLRESWGTLRHTQQKKIDSFESIRLSFLSRKSNDSYDFLVDNKTWSNLNLEEIFDQINNTQTSLGGEKLYAKLRLLKFSKDDTFEKLKSYLSQNDEKRENLQIILSQLGKKNNNQAYQIVYDLGLKGIKYDKFYIVLGLLPIFSLFLACINNIFGSMIFISSISFNIIFYLFKKYTIEIELERMSYLVQTIRVSKKLSKEDFIYNTELAKKIKNFKVLNFLGYIFIRKTDGSDISIIFEYINAIFMIPFIAYSQLNSKLLKYNQEIKELLEIISSLDMAIANLNYLNYCDYYCVPTFLNSKGLEGKKLYHPLINNPISNSIIFKDNMVISGNNASGKTTFMRTIAINCILAQSLNFALAQELSISYGGIMTSMNVGDNIINSESHFVAEGKRIHELIDILSNNNFNYFFLDEIFNGTNSAERVSIGISLIQWLLHENCLYMLTTHDSDLIEMAADFNQNYYFTSEGHQNDYKIKKGISTTNNAITTLEKLGYPEEIINNSKIKLRNIEINKVDK